MRGVPLFCKKLSSELEGLEMLSYVGMLAVYTSMGSNYAKF